MGLFEGIDIESAADDPFAVDDGTYAAFVTEIKVGLTKDESKTGMTTTFRISEGENEGKLVSRWLLVPTIEDPKNPTADESRALSFLKSHLMSLGVPAEQVNSVDADDLIGTEVYINVRSANGYTNVRRITLKD